MNAFSIIEFVVQSIVATIGAFVLGRTCGVLPPIVVALLVKNPGPVNFADDLVDQRAFRVLLDNPYFLAPVIVFVALGIFSNRGWKSNPGNDELAIGKQVIVFYDPKI